MGWPLAIGAASTLFSVPPLIRALDEITGMDIRGRNRSARDLLEQSRRNALLDDTDLTLEEMDARREAELVNSYKPSAFGALEQSSFSGEGSIEELLSLHSQQLMQMSVRSDQTPSLLQMIEDLGWDT